MNENSHLAEVASAKSFSSPARTELKGGSLFKENKSSWALVL
jgi:hypothetical protein